MTEAIDVTTNNTKTLSMLTTIKVMATGYC